MKVTYANIRSVAKNSVALQGFLTNFRCDITLLSETWLTTKHETSSFIGHLSSDFYCIRQDRKKKKGGGVVIILKKHISHSLVFSESVLNGYEILVVDLSCSCFTLRIVLLYRPPSCSLVQTNQLFKCVADFSSCSHPVICVGDFNIPGYQSNLCSSPSNALCQALFDMSAQCQFRQIVSEPSRKNAMLDLIFVSCSDQCKNFQIRPPIGTSDHNTLCFDLCYQKLPVPKIKKHVFSKANYNNIRTFLSSINWVGSFSNFSTVSEMYDMFIDILSYTIREFVPVIEIEAEKCGLPQNIQKMYDHRELLWRETLRTNCPITMEKFKSYSEKFNRELDKFSKYRDNKILRSGKYSDIHKLIKFRCKSQKSNSAVFGSDGSLNYTDEQKANCLADHFESVYTADNNEQGQVAIDIEFPMPEITSIGREEIVKLIDNWKNSRSLTPDGIPMCYIKKVSVEIGPPLEFLFNLSLWRAEVPELWKHSFVTALPKKTPHNNPKNYRPISITSLFSRLMEKVLKKHIVNHLEVNDLISVDQHGFCKGKSVETQMLESLNDWTLAVDNKKCVDVVYFDFSKAFDRVSHKKLIYKLECIGIHPKVVRWISEFLTNRTFQVKINNCFSSVKQITSGVPQGGCLSPILFNIYTFELPRIIADIPNVKCKMFADDIKIYQEFKEASELGTLEKAIQEIQKWAELWQLPLSAEKTTVMHIGSRQPEKCYYIGNHRLNSTKGPVRDLGFLITSDLKFDHHCRQISLKAKRKLFNLFKVIKVKNVKTLIAIYTIYVRPIVEFGTTIFNSNRSTLEKILESVQNTFTRRLYARLGWANYARIPSAEYRNRRFCLPTLAKRRAVNDLTMVHRLVLENGSRFNKFFTFESSRTRGSKLKLKFPKPSTQMRAKFFTVRAASKYLRVTKNLGSILSVKSFKRHVECLL